MRWCVRSRQVLYIYFYKWTSHVLTCCLCCCTHTHTFSYIIIVLYNQHTNIETWSPRPHHHSHPMILTNHRTCSPKLSCTVFCGKVFKLPSIHVCIFYESVSLQLTISRLIQFESQICLPLVCNSVSYRRSGLFLPSRCVWQRQRQVPHQFCV